MKQLCVLLASAIAFAAQGPTPRFSDPARKEKLIKAMPAIDELFARFFKTTGTPGLVYGVVIEGELVHTKSFGVSNVESQAPVTADTVFRIASMTKSFTALAVLKLRDEGKLSLEDPVSKWIPEFSKFEKGTGDTAPVRIRQLLTHGAGFPEDNPWGDRQLDVDDAKLTRWLEKGIPLSTPPGTAYEYSNYGFALLGRIVTKASGVPYSRYLREQILRPLGMGASALEPAEVPANRRATGYRKLDDRYVEEKSLADGTFGPMGGLLVSANDLARYVAYQLSAYPPRDDRETGPIRRSSQREMQQPWRHIGLNVARTPPDGPLRASASAYGYGLRINEDCRFGQIVAHGGGLPGFGSYMSWLPEYGVGFFAMSNLTYNGPSAPISDAYDELRKTGALRPRELPASEALQQARASLVKLWHEWDDGAARELAAGNLFLDVSSDRIRKDIEKLKGDLGSCEPSGEIQPENWLRGRFRMSCEKGFVDTFFTLAPTQPPTVQQLQYTPAHKPTDAMRREAEGLAQRSPYGACRVREQISGNGRDRYAVRLECARGDVDLRLTFNDEGQVRTADWTNPQYAACMP